MESYLWKGRFGAPVRTEVGGSLTLSLSSEKLIIFSSDCFHLSSRISGMLNKSKLLRREWFSRAAHFSAISTFIEEFLTVSLKTAATFSSIVLRFAISRSMSLILESTEAKTESAFFCLSCIALISVIISVCQTDSWFNKVITWFWGEEFGDASSL